MIQRFTLSRCSASRTKFLGRLCTTYGATGAGQSFLKLVRQFGSAARPLRNGGTTVRRPPSNSSAKTERRDRRGLRDQRLRADDRRGRRIGAVTRSPRGAYFAWDPTKKLSDHAMAVEAEAAVQNCAMIFSKE